MPFDPYTLTLAQVGDEAQGDGNANAGDSNDTSSSQDGGSEKEDAPANGLFSGPMFWIIMLGMIVLWVFLLGGGQRKQKKKQAMMLSAMTKGSKIITIGGIKGSVIEVRDDEVLVKVDESANTRLRFSRDAIRTVVEPASSSGASASSSSSDDAK